MSSPLKQNTTNLQDLLNKINELPEAGADPILQEKTIEPTKEEQLVTSDNGYDGLSLVTVNPIPADYIETSDATATQENIFAGFTAYVKGEKVTGNFTIQDEIEAQQALIAAIEEELKKKQAASILQDKTVTPSLEEQTISADEGYDALNTVTVEGDSNLLAENIKSGVSIFGVSGAYEGNGSGSGDTNLEDDFIEGRLSTYTNNRVKTIRAEAFYNYIDLTAVNFLECSNIGSSAFYSCSNLTSLEFPLCTSIGSETFAYCTGLTSIDFPECANVGYGAFYGCSSLTTISFPKCSYIATFAFYGCSNLTSIELPVCSQINEYALYDCRLLTSVSFPMCTGIKRYAFYNCYRLSQIYLMNSSVCILSISAFTNTPFTGYSFYFSGIPYIYVPASLVDAYKSATNWAQFSSYISAYEDTN